MMPIPQIAMLCVAAVAAVTDWRTGYIPNWLTLPVVVIAPPAYYLGYGSPALIGSLVGLFACAFVPYLLFRKDAIGGGDVKLFAALGAVGGIQLGIEAQLFGLGAAAIFGLAIMAWRGALRRTLMTVFRLATNPIAPKNLRAEVTPDMMTSMRLGVPVFVGTVTAILAAGFRF
jgi:prepilin peptidase CpaA